MIKVCPICGNKFEVQHEFQKYCSRECRIKGERYLEHLNNQAYYREHHGLNRYKKTCPVCGKKFITNRPKKKFCSEECKNINHLEYSKNYYHENKRPEPYKKICVVCGKEYSTHYPKSVCCSDECRIKHYGKKFKKRKRIRRAPKYPCSGYSEYSIPPELCLNCNKKVCRYDQ